MRHAANPNWLTRTLSHLGERATGPVLDGGVNLAATSRSGDALVESMEVTREKISPEQHVGVVPTHRVSHPGAIANLYEMYYATAWNRRLAGSHDIRANHFRDVAVAAFERDAELTEQYHALEDGKWVGNDERGPHELRDLADAGRADPPQPDRGWRRRAG